MSRGYLSHKIQSDSFLSYRLLIKWYLKWMLESARLVQQTWIDGQISQRQNKVQPQITYLLICSPSEDSDQTAHSRSLIRIFTWCILDSQGFKFSLCGQRRRWSDYLETQADLSLCFAHISEVFLFCLFCVFFLFVMLRLYFSNLRWIIRMLVRFDPSS